MTKPLRIKVRGIRSPTQPGFVLGRVPGGGIGDVQQLSISDLAGGLPAPGSVIAGHSAATFLERDSPLIAITSGVVTPLVSTGTLAAGTWDLTASVVFAPQGSATTFTRAVGALSLNPVLLPPPPNHGGYASATGALSTSADLALIIGPMRLILAAPTVVWLVALATFS